MKKASSQYLWYISLDLLMLHEQQQQDKQHEVSVSRLCLCPIISLQHQNYVRQYLRHNGWTATQITRQIAKLHKVTKGKKFVFNLWQNQRFTVAEQMCVFESEGFLKVRGHKTDTNIP